ncbi:MAG: glyoxylate/hydroxypyruvate reductase A [Rhizobiaceae bacterium]
MSSQADTILLSLTNWDPKAWLDQFQVHAPERKIVLEPDGANDPSIRYAIVWKQRSGLLAKLPNLEVILSLGAGVDHIFHDTQVPDLPIVRVVAPDLTMRMSEYVIWQVLDHFRFGRLYREQQAKGIWSEPPQPAAGEVSVGIMGLGVLGQDAAAKLGQIGFQMHGWSRNAKQVPGVKCHHGQDGLGAFLAASDIVVVLLPLTDDTRGIVNADLLSRMKPKTPLGGPVLINAGRGKLQVERDILSALDSGRLMAASLDVFEQEPLPTDSALWKHPRVFITPHAAANSDPKHLVPLMLRQMERHEQGLGLEHLVDRTAGY